MKKIYSKITRERAPRFQIETAIYQDEAGQKYVDKCQISPAGEEHIANIYRHYEAFSLQNKATYVECQRVGKGLRFPFIKGKSYFEYLLEAVTQGHEEVFYQTLDKYRKRVEEVYQECQPFRVEKQFTPIFGVVEGQEGVLASPRLNIDLTFDNMIVEEDGQTKIIDYEWMFDCLVPLKFVYFRAVKAFFVKNHALLEGFMTREAVNEFFGISQEDVATYENMNNCFMDYINDNDNSYDKIIGAYAKPPVTQGMTVEVGTGEAQLFVNDGSGYIEGNCILTVIPDEHNVVSLEVDLSEYPNIKELRIDPLNVSAVIRMRKFYFSKVTGNEAIKMEDVLHNGWRGQDDIWIFENDDPQILIPLKPEDAVSKIYCEFEILMTNMEAYQGYINPYKEKLQMFKHSEAGRMTRLVEEQRVQNQRIVHLLKDKLAYIEGTKLYKLLLKKKVDAISIWDEIE